MFDVASLYNTLKINFAAVDNKLLHVDIRIETSRIVEFNIIQKRNVTSIEIK